jgi:integrase
LEVNGATTAPWLLFLDRLRELYPQHFAMTYVGLALGLRPSSLRPMRRSGATPDILWDENVLLVRRSQTVGEEVMNTTKTKKKQKQKTHVPAELMEVLRWHVQTQLVTPEMQESDLLFPAINGKFRAPTVLNKPFGEVSAEIGLGKRFTQKGMRRTFQDLARGAGLRDEVQRRICGHITTAMTERYLTVAQAEQREGIGKVVALMGGRPESKAKGTPASESGIPEAVHRDGESR